MEFLSRLFGWDKASNSCPPQDSSTSPPPPRAAPRAAPPCSSAPASRPGSRAGVAATAVLEDVGPGTRGSVQGLAWFAHTLRQDSDGDYAHAFMDEREMNKGAGAAPRPSQPQHKRGRRRGAPPKHKGGPASLQQRRRAATSVAGMWEKAPGAQEVEGHRIAVHEGNVAVEWT